MKEIFKIPYINMYNPARERIPSESPHLEAGPSETLLIGYVNQKSVDCTDRLSLMQHRLIWNSCTRQQLSQIIQ